MLISHQEETRSQKRFTTRPSNYQFKITGCWRRHLLN